MENNHSCSACCTSPSTDLVFLILLVLFWSNSYPQGNLVSVHCVSFISFAGVHTLTNEPQSRQTCQLYCLLMASSASAMAHLRDSQFQQASPTSFSAAGADAANVTGTPNSRLVAFSPNTNSVKSVSKLIQTPDRAGSEKGPPLFSPTHSSGGGLRSAAISGDQDPFITPSSRSKAKNQLSATAMSFRPFYDSMSSGSSAENQPQSADERDNSQLPKMDQVSPVLSTELHLSRCVEFTCPSQVPSTIDVETYFVASQRPQIKHLLSFVFVIHSS